MNVLHDETPHAILEAGRVEIHQQAGAELTHAQICHDLCFMGGDERSDGLDFKNDRVRDRMSARKPRGIVFPL